MVGTSPARRQPAGNVERNHHGDRHCHRPIDDQHAAAHHQRRAHHLRADAAYRRRQYGYTATFAAATGGTGSFTYTATGLPSGLALSGNNVRHAPVTGNSTVALTATDSAGTSVTATVTLSLTNPVSCSGKNAVESAYVARNPGYIVVNGGLNLLDHLWTTNLNLSNTIFLGGLVNWYQTGLILEVLQARWTRMVAS